MDHGYIKLVHVQFYIRHSIKVMGVIGAMTLEHPHPVLPITCQEFGEWVRSGFSYTKGQNDYHIVKIIVRI